MSAWIWHFVAGVFGVIVSVSAFYQALEKRFSVHTRLEEKDVSRIVDGDDREVDKAEFLGIYNKLIFMGRSAARRTASSPSVTVYLHSGERIEITRGPKFYDVRRVKRSGRESFYRLLEQS